tara:strand:+ start:260 stop:706 length:447 start_codon:yes stop_codon:yes gene_type:complete
MAGPFKMKAGKEGPMRKNFPSAFQKKGDKAKLKSMNAVHDAVTGDMTDQQLRDMAVSQHGGKSSKFNVDVRYLKKLRTARRTKDVKKPVQTKKETLATSPKDKMQAFTISEEDRRSIHRKYGTGPKNQAERIKATQEAADRFASRRGF